jgi:ATP-dependent exoDNAse (exonuclease V) alpha subunit
VVSQLTRAGELVELDGGRWTTRELRELELRTLDRVADLAHSETPGMSAAGLTLARESARRQIGGPLTREQQDALATVAGAGNVAVLVGQAGTGKGVVIAAARAAWEHDGHRVIGTAVAGATAKRLGADAGIAEAMTMDALTTRHRSGRLGLDGRSVIVVDEAGMADTRRLAKVAEAASESRAKLVLVGDAAQLSPIGAGGLFAEIAKRSPSAELTTVHRAREDWERRAWGQLRAGDPGKALGAYASRTGSTSRTREPTLVSGWSTTGRGRGRRTRARGS